MGELALTKPTAKLLSQNSELRRDNQRVIQHLPLCEGSEEPGHGTSRHPTPIAIRHP